MEPAANQNREGQCSTQVRNPEVDIIKGASDTSSIPTSNGETLQDQDSAGTTVEAILDVVKSNTPNGDGHIAPSEDLNNPAVRGI